LPGEAAENSAGPLSPVLQPVDAPAAPSSSANAAAALSSPPPSRPPPELVSRTPHSKGEREPLEIDSTRLLNRVARAFAAAQDGGEVRLRLSPPELGALRLEVSLHEGALIARLEAETTAARTALIENLPALRDRLADQGVRIERFDVELSPKHNGGTPDRPADRQPPEQPPIPPPVRQRRLPQVAEGVVGRVHASQDLDLRRLNVVV
jgi:flagellar hook-length control protein FliK